jgi:hypothetical protein
MNFLALLANSQKYIWIIASLMFIVLMALSAFKLFSIPVIIIFLPLIIALILSIITILIWIIIASIMNY